MIWLIGILIFINIVIVGLLLGIKNTLEKLFVLQELFIKDTREEVP